MGFSHISQILSSLGLGEEDQERKATRKRRFAEYLRANQTASERLMARCLFHLGINALPQQPVIGYIADFLDEEHGVVFEVDGSVHDTRHREDRFRDDVMIEAGYRVIRFSNDGVRNLMQNIAAVRDAQ